MSFAEQFEENTQGKEQQSTAKRQAQAMEAGEKMAMVLAALSKGSAQDSMLGALSVAHGALRVAGGFCADWQSLIGDVPTGLSRKFINLGCDPDCRLFAALLLVVAFKEDDEGCETKFGPPVYLEAMEMFEKITGRKLDDSPKVNRELIEAAREYDPATTTEPETVIYDAAQDR